MSFFVYILYNDIHSKFYIGQTGHLDARINAHNKGRSDYTSRFSGEWRLVYTEEFTDRSVAIKREQFLKKQKNKNFYKRLCQIEDPREG